MKFLRRKKYLNSLKNIKCVVFDLDGVFTDGGLYVNDDGNFSRKYNVKDGLGIKMLQKMGLDIVVISGGKGLSLQSRLESLSVTKYFCDVKNKKEVLSKFLVDNSFSKDDLIFIGDDLNDLVVKDIVKVLIVPQDAEISIKKKSDWILNSKGGCGAVRELCEDILKANGNWKNFSNHGWFDINI